MSRSLIISCKPLSLFYSVQEMPAMYPDRVITIRGTPENVSRAEHAISNKLRECYEKEMSVPMVSDSNVSYTSMT